MMDCIPFPDLHDYGEGQTERINEGHLICTLPVLGSTDAFLLIICEGSFTDA